MTEPRSAPQPDRDPLFSEFTLQLRDVKRDGRAGRRAAYMLKVILRQFGFRAKFIDTPAAQPELPPTKGKNRDTQ